MFWVSTRVREDQLFHLKFWLGKPIAMAHRLNIANQNNISMKSIMPVDWIFSVSQIATVIVKFWVMVHTYMRVIIDYEEIIERIGVQRKVP